MREHGKRARYIRGPDENDTPGVGCRCQRCEAANANHARHVNRMKAYGRWHPYVPAEPVRKHLAYLATRGIKTKRAAQLSGISQPNVDRIAKGIAKRVRPETQDAILSVEPSAQLLTDRARIDGTGTRRRLQALVAMGWTRVKLAQRAGINRRNLIIIMRAATVRAETARKVAAVYDELWNQAPPERTPAERTVATKARAEAAAKGWPLPAAWDDDLIDLPDAELKAEIERQAAAMDDVELQRCFRAKYVLGDTTPLMLAGAREFDRRRRARKNTKGVAA